MSRLVHGCQVALATVLFSFAALAQGPCPTVPNTGCTNTEAPFCSGMKTIGTTLTITCLDTGRGLPRMLYVGGCATPVPLSAPITCAPLPNTCGFGLDLALPIVAVNGSQPLSIPIPNDPALVGLSVCFQCSERSPLGCLGFTPAISVTIDGPVP